MSTTPKKSTTKRTDGIETKTEVIGMGPDPVPPKEEKIEEIKPIIATPPDANGKYPTLKASVTDNVEFMAKIKRQQDIAEMSAAELGFEQEYQLWQRKKQEVINEIKRIEAKCGGKKPHERIFPHDHIQWVAQNEELQAREKILEDIKEKYGQFILFNRLPK